MTDETANDNAVWPSPEDLGAQSRTYAFRALKIAPEFFVFALIALLLFKVCEGILTGELSPPGSVWLQTGLKAEPRFLESVILLGDYFLSVVTTACVAIFVHRFILLGENPNSLGLVLRGYTWNFVVWILAIGLLDVIIDLPFPIWLRLLILLPIIIIDFRLSLIFPAVAIGAASRGALERIRDSWKRTRGKVLLLFYAGIVAALPLIVITVGLFLILLIASIAHSAASIDSDSPRLLSYVSAIMLFLSPFSGVYGTCCAAAVASCAYRVSLGIDGGGQIGERTLSHN